MIPTQVFALLEPLVKSSEGCRLTAYKDPAGYWTVGYGHKLSPGQDGQGLTIQNEEALAYLESDLDMAYQELLSVIPDIALASPGKQAALTDFVYNLGVGRFQRSTLRSYVQTQQWDQVKVELMKWTRAGGVIEQGLVRRRTAECSLIDQ